MSVVLPKLRVVALYSTEDSDAPLFAPWKSGFGLKPVGVTLTDSYHEDPLAVEAFGIARDCPMQGGETWARGDKLWATAIGGVTKNRPAAPIEQVYVGEVIKVASTLATVAVALKFVESLTELSGVAQDALADKNVPIYSASSGTFETRQIDHGSDVAGLEDPADHPQYKTRHGVEVGTDGVAPLTVSYNKTSRVFTLTPTGASFNVWINGVKYVKTGAQAAPAHAASYGKHFVYWDANGALQSGTTPWSIVDRTKAPAGLVLYSTDISDGIPLREHHSADRDLALHANLHSAQGCKVVSGLALSGYTLNTDSDVGVTFAIAAGEVADEDLRTTISAVADNGPYCVLWRQGATGAWRWSTTDVLPFKKGTTYPQWNELTGGSWQLTELVGTGLGEWVNYYLVVVPSAVAATQVILIPGQAKHTSLASAQGESIASLDWGTVPFEEVAPVARLTFHARSTYGGTAKVQLQGITAILAGGASITNTQSPAIHNSLSGRDAAGAHPITALSTTETDTTKRLAPDGAGGVTFAAGGGAVSFVDLADVDWSGANDGDIAAWDADTSTIVPVAPGTPAAHASTHQSGGGDAIKLDDLATPDDNTDLNATTGRHGLLLKLGGGTTNFLRADGTWAAPPGGSPTIWTPEQAPASPNTEDDEFEGSTLNAKWTEATDAASHVHGTLIPSCISIYFSGNQYYTLTQSYSPSATFSLTAKASLWPTAQYHGLSLFLRDSTDNEQVLASLQAVSSSVQLGISTRDSGTWTYNRYTYNMSTLDRGRGTVWLHVQRSSNSWAVWGSFDGRSWVPLTAYSKTFTPDKFVVQITQSGQTQVCRVALDFVRRDWLTL